MKGFQINIFLRDLSFLKIFLSFLLQYLAHSIAKTFFHRVNQGEKFFFTQESEPGVACILEAKFCDWENFVKKKSRALKTGTFFLLVKAYGLLVYEWHLNATVGIS